MNVGPGPQGDGQIGGDSANEASPALENGPHLLGSTDGGGAHESQGIQEGEQLVEGKPPRPIVQGEGTANVEKRGSRRIVVARRPSVLGGNHTLESLSHRVLECHSKCSTSLSL